MQGVPSTRAIAKVFLTVVVLAAALYFAYLIRGTLKLVFISVFLAVALGPAVDLLERIKLPRSLAILAVYLSIGTIVFGVGLLIVPPVVEQVDQFAQDVPGYVTDLRTNQTLRRYDDKYEITVKLKEQADSLPAKLGDAAGALQAVTVGAFSAAVQLVTVLTMTFFLLLDGGKLFTFLLSLLRRERQKRYLAVAEEIYRSVAGYVSGNLLISVVAGLVAYLTLTLLGVPFAIPLAVLMAFLDLIPLVGATLGGITIGLVTLFNDFPGDTIVWGIVFIVYQQIENNLLQPIVYRRTVNVHPLIVIVAILIGSSLLGVLGALVAIPVAAATQILVKDWWVYRSSTVAIPAEASAEETAT